jgi:hypothetical protein
MPLVFFDESGFTGTALLDPDQPSFVIASSIVTDEEAARFLRDVFPDFRGEEFKFKKLWGRPNYRRRFVPLCNAVGTVPDNVFLWEVDKKFCALTKMIDFLVEPVAHDAGYDFYKNSHANKFANYIHFGLTCIGSPDLYTATVNAYYAFARDPTDASLELLTYRLLVMANSAPKELEFFFRTAYLGAVTFHEHSDIATFRDSLEIYLPSILNSVAYWTARVAGGVDIRYDRSKAFFGQKSVWEAITSKQVPAQLHPVANGPPIQFPLSVNSTEATDSKTSPAIQLCDLVAGLAVKFMNTPEGGEGREILDAIAASSFGNVPINGLVPQPNFPEDGPAPLDGPDAVDRMVRIIRDGRKQQSTGDA